MVLKHAADVQAVIDRCLIAKDQKAFAAALVLLVLVGEENAVDIDALATERLEAMDHEVQVYWKGECNCNGHLN